MSWDSVVSLNYKKFCFVEMMLRDLGIVIRGEKCTHFLGFYSIQGILSLIDWPRASGLTFLEVYEESNWAWGWRCRVD